MYTQQQKNCDMQLEELLTKKILVWGYGQDGKASLNFLLKHKIKDKVFVATTTKSDEIVKNVEFIEEKDILKHNFDLVLKSPGVSYYKDDMRKLEEKGVLITSGLNVLLAKTNKIRNLKVVAITGTKGKSTTVSI
ncbi:MAG: hypothetical protein LBG48_02115, partial [Rickettsiales bacterium]|nr:hypothetical protein [Rickettsiales bacterium]